MTYRVRFSLLSDPDMFYTFRNAVTFLKDKYSESKPENIVLLLEQEYGVILKVRHSIDNATKYEAIFLSEQEYAMFILRWS